MIRSLPMVLMGQSSITVQQKKRISLWSQKDWCLMDTGGHYLEGTTDITRTVVLGSVTEKEEIFHSCAPWTFKPGSRKIPLRMYGTESGFHSKSDPLWAMGEDYNHGTGHGVGYLLNVHEGPQSFRWKNPADRPAPVLEEGMITSDEPGYYAENEFGIRHENLVVCKKQKNSLRPVWRSLNL
ncbi:MAG: M24 family metallopeptidase [Blautia massiliensis (ex Durand et al. 2017)]